MLSKLGDLSDSFDTVIRKLINENSSFKRKLLTDNSNEFNKLVSEGLKKQ